MWGEFDPCLVEWPRVWFGLRVFRKEWYVVMRVFYCQNPDFVSVLCGIS